ncbi:MAG: hypothetical protein ACK4UJ_07785 [Leptonema sp. (in: bacteria)]
MRKWSELSEKERSDIEKRYNAGESPTQIAQIYGLKPKQISDQAYRKGWKGGTMKAKKTAKKTATTKKTAKKTVKKK